MTESQAQGQPTPPPVAVGRGLTDVIVDPSTMSPGTKNLYEDYLAVTGDDSPADAKAHEAAIQRVEHALRGGINADKLNRTLGEGKQDSSNASS